MKRIVCLTAMALSGCLFLNAQQQKNPESTEIWEPVPPVVTPGEGTQAPSDAVILFDGKNLDQWENGKGAAAAWTIEGGAVTVKPGTGTIQTKRGFGDCQLHIEFREPTVITGDGQGRGNSGIFLQGLYEVQVLDCYNNKTYSNGQTASLYKQHIPLVNACKKPGEWQTYDIIYTAPRFGESGRVITPGYVTVIHNGVLAQNHVALWGTTEYIGSPRYSKHDLNLPIVLQDHGNLVSFRNIWIREL
ncbi:MAG TPA: DUF1080 domain-containing protein [Bacteroidales bacterium]|nr:DUF1080 domain-containing protein [Bacteroidales bacterium]